MSQCTRFIKLLLSFKCKTASFCPISDKRVQSYYNTNTRKNYVFCCDFGNLHAQNDVKRKCLKEFKKVYRMIFYCKLATQCDIEDLIYRLSKSLSIAANASLGMLRLSRSWLTWSLLHPHFGPTFKYKYKYNVQV